MKQISKGIVLIVINFVCCSLATQVQQCSFGSGTQTNLEYNTDELSSMVRFQSCNVPPCKVAKGTSQEVEIQFEPKYEIKSLSNSIYGVIGIPLPYPGVFGTSACNNIWLNDTKSPCPLHPGTKYTYKNKFPVLAIYPEIPVKVHWALTDSDQNLDVICFEVNARIVPAK